MSIVQVTSLHYNVALTITIFSRVQSFSSPEVLRKINVSSKVNAWHLCHNNLLHIDLHARKLCHAAVDQKSFQLRHRGKIKRIEKNIDINVIILNFFVMII